MKVQAKQVWGKMHTKNARPCRRLCPTAAACMGHGLSVKQPVPAESTPANGRRPAALARLRAGAGQRAGGLPGKGSAAKPRPCTGHHLDTQVKRALGHQKKSGRYRPLLGRMNVGAAPLHCGPPGDNLGHKGVDFRDLHLHLAQVQGAVEGRYGAALQLVGQQVVAALGGAAQVGFGVEVGAAAYRQGGQHRRESRDNGFLRGQIGGIGGGGFAAPVALGIEHGFAHAQVAQLGLGGGQHGVALGRGGK
ncbi:hypothetical protein D0T11_08650 [Hymenobacter rubripertinctus]|uniref:Uncharacterized protein n=1 Tax=Hymenobacter rubripertinctus TaxID=2029981 RepID=A0A418R0V8_9BACT|nr:hypothetical protein D0T11_08650 [Hymenobacter rubripertinctus]